MVTQEIKIPQTGQGQTIEMFLGSLRGLKIEQQVKSEKPATELDANEVTFFRDFTLLAVAHIEKKTLSGLGSSAITILKRRKPDSQDPYLSPIKIYEKLRINLNRNNQSREEIEKAEGYIINGSCLMFKKLLTESSPNDGLYTTIERYKNTMRRDPEKYASHKLVKVYKNALTQLFTPKINGSTEKPQKTGECIRIKGADGTSYFGVSILKVFDYYSFYPEEKELLKKETDPKIRAKLLLKAGNSVGLNSIKVGEILDNFDIDENWNPIAKKQISVPNPTATSQP